jgi:hypothetical protein
MFTRVGNIIFASVALLVFLMSEAGCHSAVSSSRSRLQHGPVTVREIVADSIVLIWFAGAVGLSSRKRLAWIGSLLGVGASACFFAASLVMILWLYFHPSPEMGRTQALDGAGFIATHAIAVGEFAILLSLSLALFIGLLQMRKELK